MIDGVGFGFGRGRSGEWRDIREENDAGLESWEGIGWGE